MVISAGDGGCRHNRILVADACFVCIVVMRQGYVDDVSYIESYDCHHGCIYMGVCHYYIVVIDMQVMSDDSHWNLYDHHHS